MFKGITQFSVENHTVSAEKNLNEFFLITLCNFCRN